MNKRDRFAQGIRKVDDDLSFMISCFTKVLNELGYGDLAKCLPWQGGRSSVTVTRFGERGIQAYSIAFQLLNMVEENASAQARRRREDIQGLSCESGLWGQAFRSLRSAGVSPEEIAGQLSSIKIEPVLTAHPTEAKRTTVLECHRYLYTLLVKRENTMWTRYEQEQIREEIKATLERLWRTGEIYLRKPDVGAELRNILYFLGNVFPESLTRLDIRMRQAWAYEGLNSALLNDPRRFPQLALGTWVGGDRDGHPLVTAQVTQGTLQSLRQTALELWRKRLDTLASHLSMGERLQEPKKDFVQRLHQLIEMAGSRDVAQEVLARNEGEPWRQMVSLIRLRLPDPNGLVSCGYQYNRSQELLDDLWILRESLVEIGAGKIARNEVEPLWREVQTFGFHMAALDIRQNSAFHDKALAQLACSAGLPCSDFAQWTENKRRDFLEKELASPRPFIRDGENTGGEAGAVLTCYRVLAEHARLYGTGGLGSLIVSMTRGVSDLLTVYVLARETGLLAGTADSPWCLLPGVPLFETIDDLERSSEIMDAFLAHPVTRRTLLHHQKTTGANDLVQQIMIGYSDSNKDGGLIASSWGLSRAQERLSELGKKHGIRIVFFHGRGGTISRGAGPTHRFIEALPWNSVNGGLRVTEQGESISQKYTNFVTAVHNLELLTAGETRRTLTPDPIKPDEALERIMDTLAVVSSEAYQELLKTDGFMTFFRQATPIDVIESSSIGSRPARRTGAATLTDLRAIPWVFSWSQSRFYISGWYGVGTALHRLKESSPSDFSKLSRSFKTWAPLRYIMTNAATGVLTANPKVMKQYAGLVSDTGLRRRFMNKILAEHRLTSVMLDELSGAPIRESRPRLRKVLSLREEAVDVLHRQQVSLIREWRALQSSGKQKQADQMLPELLLSVNAIASGLQTTG